MPYKRRMRALALLPFALLTAGCWTPAPGQRDPTRYPWDPRNRVAVAPAPAPHPRVDARGIAKVARDPSWAALPPQPVLTPENSYCVMAIEQERKSGINTSANAGVLTCSAQPNAAPGKPPR